MKRMVALSIAATAAFSLIGGASSAQASTAERSSAAAAPLTAVKASGVCDDPNMIWAGQLTYQSGYTAAQVRAVLGIDQYTLALYLLRYHQCGYI